MTARRAWRSCTASAHAPRRGRRRAPAVGLVRVSSPRWSADSTLATDAGPIASIGVDTWGVDYGLFDRHGELVEAPLSYRDDRTAVLRRRRRAHRRAPAVRDQRAPEPRLQHDLPARRARPRTARASARHLLMLPELLVHHLTGVITGERTSAGTTGLLDVRTLRLVRRALRRHRSRSLAAPRPPTCRRTPAGTWRGVPVHLVGGHDTASAVWRAPRTATRSCRAVPGRSPAANDHSRTRRTPHGPRASATSRPRSVASDSCATSPAGGWSSSAVDAWGGDRRRICSRPPARVDGRGPDLRRRPTRASSRRPTWLRSCGRHPGFADAEPSRRDPLRGRVDGGRDREGHRRPASRHRHSRLRRRVAVDVSTSTRSGDAPVPVTAGPIEATALGQRARPGPRARSVRVGQTMRRATLVGPRGGRPMNVQALDRLELMRKRLDADGRVLVAELATELDVSEMTIRRDLEMLVDEGVAAARPGRRRSVGPQQFAARFRQNARAKARIAEKLLDLVGTGGAIGIDAVLDAAAPRGPPQRGTRPHRRHQRTRHFPRAARASRRHRPPDGRRARHAGRAASLARWPPAPRATCSCAVSSSAPRPSTPSSARARRRSRRPT